MIVWDIEWLGLFFVINVANSNVGGIYFQEEFYVMIRVD
jgi:hypothetical protein